MESIECKLMESRIDSLTLNSENNSSGSLGDSAHCYALLDGVGPDKKAIEQLQAQRLNYVLQQFQTERSDATFSRDCLFCRKHFTGNRSVLMDHLMEQHNFLIGSPDNIVFINELLDHLEVMLKELKCFYCEKIFKDWMTLKEHMRKKQHKRINPENKIYDRFYLINYLEAGKTWKDVMTEPDDSPINSENEIMDCENDGIVFVCLFCDEKSNCMEAMLEHMKNTHSFDLKMLKSKHQLDFYQQLKLINFLRKKVYQMQCTFCEVQCPTREDLILHMTSTSHISQLPDPTLWNQPEYFFPTFENDNMLCTLDDCDGPIQECTVYPEDIAKPSLTREDIQNLL